MLIGGRCKVEESVRKSIFPWDSYESPQKSLTMALRGTPNCRPVTEHAEENQKEEQCFTLYILSIGGREMEAIWKRVCGLDVHKKLIVACIRMIMEDGEIRKETRKFETMTGDVLELSDWLRAHGVKHVAMESTGVYWKPIWNILEGEFDLLLVNAKHIKQVPGRKTDMKDCEWIAQLLQYGLLPKSFVPNQEQRELRELTRYRAKVVQQKAAVANRIQKVLEDANIKLSSVATDVLGVSGRDMIEKIIAGEEDSGKLAELARRKLRGKIPELKKALRGNIREHHRFMLETLFDELKHTELVIEKLDARIEEQMSPFEEEVSLIVTIPGIDRRGAEAIVAEIGTNMDQYPSAAHLASWAGVCPGNNESAGKSKSGKTPKGNRWLRRVLGECAWGAGRTKNTYFTVLYQRLASRKGRKRAVVAVSHSLLTIIYHVVKNKTQYYDLGPEHFLRLDPERYKRYHTRKLEQLGYEVTLQSKEEKVSA